MERSPLAEESENLSKSFEAAVVSAVVSVAAVDRVETLHCH